MPRYLFTGRYSPEAAKTIMATGGSVRRTNIEKMVSDLGGRMETFDFAFGSDDVFTICELPDAAKAAAVALTINASGVARLTTTCLLSPEDVDAASQVRPNYQPPSAD